MNKRIPHSTGYEPGQRSSLGMRMAERGRKFDQCDCAIQCHDATNVQIPRKMISTMRSAMQSPRPNSHDAICQCNCNPHNVVP